jgi:hypothetical protein
MAAITAHLDSTVDIVRRLRRRFAATAPTVWTPVIAVAELQRQLGHLATCLLREQDALPAAADDPGRVISDLGDELADVVLSAVSVAVLAGTVPRPARACAGTGEVVLWRLLLDAGNLAEAAMRHERARHTPTGAPPGIAAAAGAVLADCDAFARHRGLDLHQAFIAMAADAGKFLDREGIAR